MAFAISLYCLLLNFAEMVANDVHRKAVVFSKNMKLQHETFAHVARSHTRRIEGLYDFKSLLDFFDRMSPGFGNFLQSNRNLASRFVDGAQVSIFIEISDDRSDRRHVSVLRRA